MGYEIAAVVVLHGLGFFGVGLDSLVIDLSRACFVWLVSCDESSQKPDLE